MEDNDFNKKEDKELVADYLAGLDEVLPLIINRHIKNLYRFVFGLVGNDSAAEDITQDVFVKVWKNLKKYDDKYSFKTWLFSIARNTVIDYFRKKKDVAFSRFDNEEGENFIMDTLSDDQPLAHETFAKMEDAAFFNALLKELPPLYWEILVLRYTEDLSIEEISQVLKRPAETVKSQHRRGIMHLKKLLLRRNKQV